MKAVVTVTGKDTVGIIAKVCTYLAENQINILDISQTIVSEFFNMMMVVDAKNASKDLSDVITDLDKIGEEIGVVIKCQREEIFDKTTTFVFSRVWGNDTDEIISLDTSDANNYVKQLVPAIDTKGNDVKPLQRENPVLRTAYFKDDMGYTTEPYQFYFKKGVNTIELTAVKECVVIDKITVLSVADKLSYEDYKALNAGKPATNGTFSSRIEGEAASAKSSPTLYPTTDRTSSMTYPSSYTATKLNAIGGDNWRVLGDWISWEVEVPADGYYNISMRTKQSTVRGMYSNRIVYVDGEIAFDELKQTIFAYSADWQVVTLGNAQESFEFYLTKGVHTITMEVTLGDYAALVEEIEDVVNYLNDLYLEIIKFTLEIPLIPTAANKKPKHINRLKMLLPVILKASISLISKPEAINCMKYTSFQTLKPKEGSKKNKKIKPMKIKLLQFCLIVSKNNSK